MPADVLPGKHARQSGSTIEGALTLMALLLIGISLEGVGQGLAEAAIGLSGQLASPMNAGGNWGGLARALNSIGAWVATGLRYDALSGSLWCIVDMGLCSLGVAVVARRPRFLWRRVTTFLGTA